MAPEQLEGKEADARSDLWALGCVLYEAAAGQRAFAGESQASLIAAILEREPRPLTELKPLSPPALEHLVGRCLAKDPEQRWQSARDVVQELEWIAAASSQAGVPVPVSARRRSRERLAWILGSAAAAVAVASVAALLWTRQQPAPAPARFSIPAPEGRAIQVDYPSAAISPDGKLLVFTVIDSAATPRLWIRRLGSFSAEPLAETDNALTPFWSPVSRFIAFFASGKLQKISAGGGPPETICDAPDGRGGTWSRDGVIVFAPRATGPLQRVSCDGGGVVTVARPDSTRGETALRFPCFLPDGRHFLYVGLPKKLGQFDVHAGSLDSRENRVIMTAGSAPVYAEPGYLLFGRNGRLVAQRFDRARLRPTGKVIPLGDAPPPSAAEGAPLLCPPARDALVHVAARAANTQLAWLDRAGRRTGTVPLPPGRYEYPALSPDGRWAAVTKITSATSGDLWVVDLQRAIPTRATFDGSLATGGGAVWSPDGSRIAYQCNPSGPYDIYQVPANGTGRPEPLVQSSVVLKLPAAWSPDGKYFVYGQNEGATGWDVWLLPLTGERKPVPYLRSPFSEFGADVSPDGRWLAYSSDETGTFEVYVQSFPAPGERHRITTSGGAGAQWSRDGRELLIATGVGFGSQVGPFFSVDVQTAPTFKAGTPRLLFAPRPDLPGIAATRDLKRFLAAVPVEGAAPASITVVMNWQQALKGR
jgi:Tol biopolymer transport system component